MGFVLEAWVYSPKAEQGLGGYYVKIYEIFGFNFTLISRPHCGCPGKLLLEHSRNASGSHAARANGIRL